MAIVNYYDFFGYWGKAFYVAANYKVTLVLYCILFNHIVMKICLFFIFMIFLHFEWLGLWATTFERILNSQSKVLALIN